MLYLMTLMGLENQDSDNSLRVMRSLNGALILFCHQLSLVELGRKVLSRQRCLPNQLYFSLCV